MFKTKKKSAAKSSGSAEKVNKQPSRAFSTPHLLRSKHAQQQADYESEIASLKVEMDALERDNRTLRTEIFNHTTCMANTYIQLQDTCSELQMTFKALKKTFKWDSKHRECKPETERATDGDILNYVSTIPHMMENLATLVSEMKTFSEQVARRGPSKHYASGDFSKSPKSPKKEKSEKPWWKNWLVISSTSTRSGRNSSTESPLCGETQTATTDHSNTSETPNVSYDESVSQVGTPRKSTSRMLPLQLNASHDSYDWDSVSAQFDFEAPSGTSSPKTCCSYKTCCSLKTELAERLERLERLSVGGTSCDDNLDTDRDYNDLAIRLIQQERDDLRIKLQVNKDFLDLLANLVEDHKQEIVNLKVRQRRTTYRASGEAGKRLRALDVEKKLKSLESW